MSFWGDAFPSLTKRFCSSPACIQNFKLWLPNLLRTLTSLSLIEQGTFGERSKLTISFKPLNRSHNTKRRSTKSDSPEASELPCAALRRTTTSPECAAGFSGLDHGPESQGNLRNGNVLESLGGTWHTPPRPCRCTNNCMRTVSICVSSVTYFARQTRHTAHHCVCEADVL